MKKKIVLTMVLILLLSSMVYGATIEATAQYLEKQKLDHWGILALYNSTNNTISRSLEEVESELMTDYEAYLLGATALRKNVLKVVEKISDSQRTNGKFSDYIDGTGDDMVNAHIWGVISLYTANYEGYDKGKALQWLKENQNKDGGFSVYAGTSISDLDMSAMALIAFDILGLDHNDQEVKQTLAYLDSNISKKESCESYAWYILARVKLGLDIDESLYEGLLKHKLQDGSFKHFVSLKKSNYMATWHGLMALTDYNNKISVFDKLHNESGFVDLGTTDNQYKEIMTLVKKGIISGYSDNTFRPNASVKRGEFCKFLVYGSGLQNQIGRETFDFEDLKGHWSNKIVKVAVNKQWVQGVSSNRFAPEDKIKGSEIAAMLVRVKGFDEEAAAIKGNNWYDGYVQVASEHGLLYTNFNPNGYATRAQCSEAVYKLTEN